MIRLLILAFISLHFASSTGSRIVLTPSESQTRKTGDNFVIKCELKDSEITQVPSWFKIVDDREESVTSSSGIRIVPSVNSGVMLMFTGAKSSDAGEYKCKSGDVSSSISVRIFKSITFTDAPTIQNPLVGSDAVIKCRADADPKPVISWARGEKEIAENGGRYTVSSDGDLNIPSYDAETDNGIYTCSALQSETGDMITRDINVIGYVPPSEPRVALVDQDQWPDGVHEGSTNIRLSCAAAGVPTPTYTWSKDGRQIENDHYVVNKTSGSLEFKSINRDDGGVYQCAAENAVGKRTQDINFTVFKKPTITQIQSQQAMAGDDLRFDCIFEGTAPITSSWTHAGKVIEAKTSDYDSTTESNEDDNDGKKHEKYVFVDGNKASLHLKGVKLADAGEYQCQVSNKAGTAFERTKLEVRRAPLIVSSTLNKKVRGVLNKEYDLYCEALAVPPATWTWKKGGVQVETNEGSTEIKSSTTGDGTHYVSTLTIVPTSDSQFGPYTCIASNGIAPDGAETIELIKIEPPTQPDPVCGYEQKPTIVTVIVSAFSSAAPEHHWPTDVEIQVYRVDTLELVTTANLKFAENGNYRIPKLDPSTAYNFNVTGKNEAGYGSWAQVECETTKPAPPGIPVIHATDPIRCNATYSCSIAWTLDDTGGKPIRKYQIQYRPIVKDGEPEEQFKEESIQDATSFTFSDLKPQTTYEIRLRAINDEGWGEVAAMKMISPEASTPSITDVLTANQGPSAGAIAAIVALIVLLIIALVDVACYYTNQCGLLMCICVNWCGKQPPEMQKSKQEAMLETGVTKDTTEYEKKETIIVTTTTERLERQDDGTNETTPMISGGQNGHHERKDTTV